MGDHEAFLISNQAAGSYPFRLDIGGRYMMTVHATFGGGTVKLQVLGPDGVTYLDVQGTFNNAGAEVDLVISTFSSDGTKVYDLAPGQYKFLVTTATAVYAAIARCPQF